MKGLDQIKITLGISINRDNNINKSNIERIEMYKKNIHDIHIAHYDSNIVSSGRFSNPDLKDGEFFIIDTALNKGISVSLLMNYLIHKDYDLVIKNFKEEFYPRGIRNVVIADLELIKRMKQSFPDVHIQGSCLSYRMTEDELLEEAKEGVEIHNPAVDIIRDYKQLIANHKAGFKQKVIFSEGCMYKCPFERIERGHRWHIARNINWPSQHSCVPMIKHDFRLFYRANWVTIKRLKELSDYIEIVKLPRIATIDTKEIPNNLENNPLYYLDLFFKVYEDDTINYNLLDFNGVMYERFMRQKYRMIPSSYFDKDFFDTIGYCNMECDKLKCRKCYQIHKRIEKNYLR